MVQVIGCKNNKDSSYKSLAPRRTTMKRCNSKENLLDNLPTLGLTLRKTPSFVNLIEESLKNAGTEEQAKPRGRSSSNNDKHKASNFPVKMIKIGSWEIVAHNESHVVAKCYYAKKKLIWEVMDDGLKSKMEIQWSEISAIRGTMVKDEDGILELELNEPPIFFREQDPQPGKHSSWYQCDDFTGEQASTCRIHYLRIAPGFLDKPYRTLLHYDLRLFELSNKPFPSGNIPYFCWNPMDYMQFIAPAQDETQTQLNNLGQFSITEIPTNMTMSSQLQNTETRRKNVPNAAYCPSQMPGNDLAFGEPAVNHFPGKPDSSNPWSLEMNNFAQAIPTENSDSQYNLDNLADTFSVNDYTEPYNLDIAKLSKSQKEYLQNFLGIYEEEHQNPNEEALAITPTSLRVNSIDGRSYQDHALSNPIQIFENPNMMMDQPSYGFADAPYYCLFGGRLNNYAVADRSRDMLYNQMDQWNEATSQAHLKPGEGF